ncbi:hypothetical protein [Paenibacillus lemnae]|uniref:Uncharacterized protein n=1 Tax=Paenibacillus lemnae TaxID=1330551 RepID=A0A848MCT6_PAELE|nr:hypothetical protein [Paenibacillus lemnae]NMO97950.1 hypothetical protein [Paenibacillus lemnae]
MTKKVRVKSVRQGKSTQYELKKLTFIASILLLASVLIGLYVAWVNLYLPNNGTPELVV